MTSSLPLSVEDRTRFVNRKLADEMASFLVTVAKWGSNKAPSKTFEDYLINERNFSPSDVRKRFKSKDDSNKIKLTLFDTLDVTFLYQLLPWLCDGIARPGECQNLNDSSTLEYHLKKIKDFRNSIMHEPHGAALDKDLVDEVETTALKLFDIAGVKYGKGIDEISKAQDEAKILISTIKNTVMTEEDKVYFYRQRIVSEGHQGLREKVNASKGSASPYFEHVKSFCCLQLTNEEEDAEKTISCVDILTHAEEKGVRILVIEGQSGAGKSYLMKELQADILRKTGKIFKGSDKFDTPLLFECRKQACDTIADFASKEYPCLGATSTEKGLTEKVLSRMKTIILIDGIDEVNESSDRMLENIFAFLKNDREIFCIFTSRPFSAEEFRKKLKLEGFSEFQSLALNKLSSEEEQMAFLKTACEEGERVSSAYKGTNLNLQSPVLLAVYSYLFLIKPESLKYCKSDVHIMREWINCGLDVAQRRLGQRKIMDYEDASQNILKSISFISFHCLVKDQLDIEENEIEWLKGRIGEACRFKDIASHEILSCFFVYSSDKSKDEKLCYAHKSLQEIMSARYVAEQMKMGKYLKQISTDALNYDCLNQSSLPSGKRYGVRSSEEVNFTAILKNTTVELIY